MISVTAWILMFGRSKTDMRAGAGIILISSTGRKTNCIFTLISFVPTTKLNMKP